MGPIQSSINQTLSIAGLLTHTSPTVKTHLEAKDASSRLARAQELYETEQAKAYAAEYKKYQASGGTKSGEEWLDTGEYGEEGLSKILNQPKVAAARKVYEEELGQYGTTPESRYYANLEYHKLASDATDFKEDRTLVREKPKPTPQQDATQRAQERLRELQERRRAGRQPRIEDIHQMERRAAERYRRKLMEDKTDGQ